MEPIFTNEKDRIDYILYTLHKPSRMIQGEHEWLYINNTLTGAMCSGLSMSTVMRMFLNDWNITLRDHGCGHASLILRQVSDEYRITKCVVYPEEAFVQLADFTLRNEDLRSALKLYSMNRPYTMPVDYLW